MRKLSEREIIVATHNSGKLKEINDLIIPFGFSAKSVAELGLPEPEETGTTFEENSKIKAMAAALATGVPSLADDSGLCVDALDGSPGVYTADWAEKDDGSGRDFLMAMDRVQSELQELGAVSADTRTARFVAVLCMAWPDGHTEFFRGEVDGTIVWPPVGESGFGYDPVFMPKGYDRTFGQMSSEEKHGWSADKPERALSHRSRAFAKFVAQCLGNE